MQVVVSMSLQTCSARFTPSPATGPAWPEILTISSVAWLIVFALRLLELDQEALKLRGMRVRIVHRRRKPVDDCPRNFVFIFLNTAVALVNGNSDLIDFLSINHHRLDAFGDKGLGLI